MPFWSKLFTSNALERESDDNPAPTTPSAEQDSAARKAAGWHRKSRQKESDFKPHPEWEEANESARKSANEARGFIGRMLGRRRR